MNDTMERALNRAHDEHLTIINHSQDVWHVNNPKYGEPDSYYTVRQLPDERLACNCKAAEYGHTCKHTALVNAELTLAAERLLRVSDRSFREDYAQMVLASH